MGQDTREELDFEAADFAGGANYGWCAREGTFDNPSPDVPEPRPANAVDPILDYGHSTGRTIIGGYVVRNGQLGELEGAYLFGDYYTARIWAIRYEGSFIDIAQAMDVTDIFDPVDPTTGQRILSPFDLSSFGEDGLGRLYLVDYGDGIIYAMVPEPATWATLLTALLPAIRLARRRRAELAVSSTATQACL